MLLLVSLLLWAFIAQREKTLQIFFKRYNTFLTTLSYHNSNFSNLNFVHIQVTSVKDQEQYWALDEHYSYVSVEKFVEAFQSNFLGRSLSRDLSLPFNTHRNHPSALSTSTYGVNRMKLLKISFSWQMLLLKRDSFVYVFKYFQVSS